MYILGIESSAVSAGAAVVRDGAVISEAFVNAGLTHSKTLMGLIDNAIKNAGLTLSDMDVIAVSAGPGSFTGVRIGVSAAKGLAFPCDIPCYGISSLEAIANSVFEKDCIICPVMDARCGQVYNALFDVSEGIIKRLTPDRAVTLDELYSEIVNSNKKTVLAGDGTSVTKKYFADRGLDINSFSDIFVYQHASGVAITAQRMYNNGVQPVPAEKLLPDYLRLSQAERELRKKEQK